MAPKYVYFFFSLSSYLTIFPFLPTDIPLILWSFRFCMV